MSYLNKTIFLALLLFGAPTYAALETVPQRGRDILKKAQCNRCHNITDSSGNKNGVAAADRQIHCVNCHTWILSTRTDPKAIARQRQTFPDWDRYLNTIVHLTQLPDLGSLMRRVDPAFVRRYLDGPFDLNHILANLVRFVYRARKRRVVDTYRHSTEGIRSPTVLWRNKTKS